MREKNKIFWTKTADEGRSKLKKDPEAEKSEGRGLVWVVEHRLCDAPNPRVSVDHPSTCGKSICPVSRDTPLSKIATLAYTSYSSKYLQPIILHGSRVDYTLNTNIY